METAIFVALEISLYSAVVITIKDKNFFNELWLLIIF